MILGASRPFRFPAPRPPGPRVRSRRRLCEAFGSETQLPRGWGFRGVFAGGLIEGPAAYRHMHVQGPCRRYMPSTSGAIADSCGICMRPTARPRPSPPEAARAAFPYIRARMHRGGRGCTCAVSGAPSASCAVRIPIRIRILRSACARAPHVRCSCIIRTRV